MRQVNCIMHITQQLTCFNVQKHILFQILYIIVVPLCPASLKRFVFYKAPPSNKFILLWLANWLSALCITSFSFQVLSVQARRETEKVMMLVWICSSLHNPRLRRFLTAVHSTVMLPCSPHTHTHTTHNAQNYALEQSIANTWTKKHQDFC